MESYVAVIFFSSVCVGEWVEISPVVAKSMTGKKQKFSDSGGNEFSCPDIHNLTMMMYRSRGPESKENDVSYVNDFDPNKIWGKNKNFNFLESTKEDLISQIEERIKRFGMTREGRGKHMDFPSMETALITISLLLFAVYLIKLVMKILQSLQAKKGHLNTNMNLLLGRKKRSSDSSLETLKIMEVIDKYDTLFR